MEVGSALFTIICVCLAIFLAVVTFFVMQKNSNDEYIYRLNPFQGYYCNAIQSSSGSSAPPPTGCGQQVLQNSQGQDLLVCPQGKVINVVAAFFDVNDPLLQCAPSTTLPNSSSVFPLASATFDCSTNPDLPYCQNTYSTSDPTHAYLNKMCGGSNPGGCMMRDATAYLAKQCNGKQVCSDVLINSTFFGPLPCANIPDPAAPGADTTSFRQLPWVLGNQGLSSSEGATNPVGQTTRQDYTVHGIFACVDPQNKD